SFPQVRLAVVTAVVCAASPYLTRPTRRIGQLLVLLLALSSMYLGTAFPNDLFAAVVLGWGVAAAVHLAFKSPGGRPTTAQVGAALEELGVDVDEVHLAPVQPTVRCSSTSPAPPRARWRSAAHATSPSSWRRPRRSSATSAR